VDPSVPSTTTTVTFVLRFWREMNAGEARWRGRIEHVQSGEAVSFTEPEGLNNFIQHFCPWTDEFDTRRVSKEDMQ
jgi:hypothetical protein